MYDIQTFNVLMYPSHSSGTRRPHYGLALYSKLPVLQSCQPVSLANSNGTVVLLTVVCVYRCPSSDFSCFATAMSHLLANINSYHSDMTHHTVIMGDFNLDWLDQSVPPRMTAVLPGYRQLVTEMTTDYESALDHIYTDESNDHQ